VDRETSSADTPEMHAETLIAEHAAIFDAIARQDAEAADHLAASHNDLFRRRVYEYFVNRRNAPADLVTLAASG
jgi:DNA-binding GntR family transcriptional regulator